MATDPTENTHWKLCSSCKKPIGFGQPYYICNVSTCNRPRVGLFFCSMPCFEAHLPMMRHRDAWAEEASAPSKAAWQQELAAELSEPKREVPVERRIVTGSAQNPVAVNEVTDADVLVVVSKLKKYIRDRSGMNTAESVQLTLSNHLRHLCDQAIQEAGRVGRKTVMDRDFMVGNSK